MAVQFAAETSRILAEVSEDILISSQHTSGLVIKQIECRYLLLPSLIFVDAKL